MEIVRRISMSTKKYTMRYPENPPEWCWVSGLHDAGITMVESFKFPFDYNKFVGQKADMTETY